MRLVFSIVAMFFTVLLSAQDANPVNWSHELVNNEDGSKDLVFTATMDKGWVLYSQFTDPDGPVPTNFTFSDDSCLEGEEVAEVSKLITEQCEMFGLEVKKFKEESKFVQKLKTDCKGKLTAEVEFMTCDGMRCLPPTVIPFEVDLN